MIQLHPKFLTQDGQKVAILPYDEFLKVQEILEDLRQAKEEAKNSPTYFLEDAKKMQEQSLTDWQTAIDEIGKRDKTQQQEKIRQLFESWDKLDDEQEQKETLDIIQSLENVSI